MHWPIPDFPEKRRLSQPNYPLWLIVLCIMVAGGVVLVLIAGWAKSYGQAFLYGIIPAVMLWLSLLGLALYRYERASKAAQKWDREILDTKRYWQRWSRKQQAVVANIVQTPEETGMLALLGNLADIPAFPQKARSLSANLTDLKSRLRAVDNTLEKQCPGYRHHLSKIIVVQAEAIPKSELMESIYRQWELVAENAIAAESLYDGVAEDNFSGLLMVLCIQDWAGGRTATYSEFITAQLIVSGSFAHRDLFPVMVGVGRILSSDSLIKAIDSLFEYNCLDKRQIAYVWLSGINADERTQLARYAASVNWQLPGKNPFIALNHSFGPPGPLMFPISVSLLTDAAAHTNKMQLLIAKGKNGGFHLCLITRELFS